MINMTMSKVLKLLIILLINQLEVEYYGLIHLNQFPVSIISHAMMPSMQYICVFTVQTVRTLNNKHYQ